MITPPDADQAGLSELAVRARTDAGQVNAVPPPPGRSLAQILRADVLCIDKTGTLTKPGLHLMATEDVSGRAGPPVAEVIGALAAADEAPNETGRLLAARYPAPAGWTVQRRVPFSSARKWSGAAFDGHGTWLLGAPSIVAGARRGSRLAARPAMPRCCARRTSAACWRRRTSWAGSGPSRSWPPSGRCRRPGTSSRWSATASTTCRPSSRPTWASRWARAARPAVRSPGSSCSTGPSRPSRPCWPRDAVSWPTSSGSPGCSSPRRCTRRSSRSRSERPGSPTPSSPGT